MDPFSDVLASLRPQTAGWNMIEAHDAWCIRIPQKRDAVVFWQITEGDAYVCRDDGKSFYVATGDFVFMASPPAWAMRGSTGGPGVDFKALQADPTLLYAAGKPRAVTKVIAGYLIFAAAGADLLDRLMPPVVHVRATELAARPLGLLLAMLGEEAVADRAGRVHVLRHLLQLILIESLRRPGLGLSDALLSERAAHLDGRGWRSAPQRLLGGLAPRQRRRVLDYVEEHYLEDLPLSSLAAQAGLSERHFCTTFRQTVGQPPHRYIVGKRIDHAKYLLRADRALSVTQIAMATGFKNSSHFSTMFRALVGTTPTAYRDSF